MEHDRSRPLMRGEQEGADTLDSPTFIAQPPPYDKTAPGEPQTQDSDDTAGLLTSKQGLYQHIMHSISLNVKLNLTV